jgi:Tfp pilus assembly protein PilF
MRSSHQWLVLGLIALAGCQSAPTLPDFGLKPMPVSGSGHTPGAAAATELPANESAKLCLTTAQDLEKAGKVVEALQLYAKARQADPRLNDKVCRRLAVLCDYVGDYRQAQQEYERALQLTPQDADLLNDYGYSCYCRGSWDEAERLFRKALAINSKHDRAWINLGLTLGQQGRCDESMQAFGNVVTPAQAYANIGFVHLTQGQVEKAKVFYQLAASRDPNLELPGQVLAKLDYQENEPEMSVPSPRDSGRTSPRLQTRRPAADSRPSENNPLIIHRPATRPLAGTIDDALEVDPHAPAAGEIPEASPRDRTGS